MYTGKMIFSQVMDYAPRRKFKVCVDRYNGDKYTKSFSCSDQFRAMVFAQLTSRESLRDTVSCLNAVKSQLYHLGFCGKLTKSTLADANSKRNWRIYRDYAQVLIKQAKPLYADEPLPVNFDNSVYALDSTIIDLCMSVFPWAEFRSTKSAIKLHTLLDLQGDIPEFIHISKGTLSDMEALDYIPLKPGCLIIMDRGYIDYARLYRFEDAHAYFIVRARKNLKFRRQYSQNIEKDTGVKYDQSGVLTGFYQRKSYKTMLRRIKYYDVDQKREFVFLTNNFKLSALSVAELYRSRWRVETFFKWIKQHLHIKKFFGTDKNAVKTQIWTAVCTYLLVAIMRKRLNIERSMYEILQILGITVLQKSFVSQVFSEMETLNNNEHYCNQLSLFDF